MDKRSKRILLAFGVAILVLVVIETVRPKPVDWNRSYTSTDKIPLGSYVFYEELPGILDAPVKRITKDPFEFLRDNPYTTNELYVLINNDLYLDPSQYEKLSEFVAKGNNVLLSANDFGGTIEDSLGISTYVDYAIREPELAANFYNPKLKLDKTAKFNRGIYKTVINQIDTLNTVGLGYIDGDYLGEEFESATVDMLNFQTEDKVLIGRQLNFVRISHGQGHFYLHTLPEAFTNYYLLGANQQYAERLLSYFNPDQVYWDEYIKAGKVFIASPLRFVLMQPSLKWAYYLSLIGLVLFVIFKGKREQRTIAIVKPLANDSKDFAATIGDLHFQYKDYGNIIAKRITYFLERVRSEYYINTNQLNQEFTTKLAQKSSQNLEDTQTLVNLINNLRAKALHTEKDLIKLNKSLEKFTH